MHLVEAAGVGGCGLLTLRSLILRLTTLPHARESTVVRSAAAHSDRSSLGSAMSDPSTYILKPGYAPGCQGLNGTALAVYSAILPAHVHVRTCSRHIFAGQGHSPSALFSERTSSCSIFEA